MALRRNITKYPYQIIQTYSTNSLINLGDQLIKEGDYEGLEYLLKALNSKRKELGEEIIRYKPLLGEANEQAIKDQAILEYYNASSQANSLGKDGADNSIEKVLERTYYNLSCAAYYSNSHNLTLFLNYSTLKTSQTSENSKVGVIGNNLLDIAAYELDTTSVQIILDQAGDVIFKESGISYFIVKKLVTFISSYIPSLYKDSLERKSTIFKMIINSLQAEYITAQDLELLSYLLTKEEFDSFCRSKEIDIHSENFKDLNLLHYKLEGNSPLLESLGKTPSITEILLSRTYTDDSLSLDKVRSIYTQALDLNDISRETLKYLAFRIVENDSLKIIFGKGLTSSYMLNANRILINTDFQNKNVFNILSVVLHEFGHYRDFKLFQLGAPINLEPLLRAFTEFYQKYEGKDKDLYFGGLSPAVIKDIGGFLQRRDLEDLMSVSKEFTKAVVSLITPAAKYMGFNISICEPYTESIREFTECLKTSSPIDSFLLHQLNYRTEVQGFNLTSLPDSIFDNILVQYINSPEYNPDNLLNRDEIISWSNTTFLPRLISDNNITDHQLHYLSRISDLVNRGEHVLSGASNTYAFKGGYINVDVRTVEATVRALEFEAAGICEEDSCRPLNDFVRKYIITAIQEEISDSFQQKLSVYGECLALLHL